MTKVRNKWLNPEYLTWVFFVLAIACVYLFALDLPLLGPDEPRYSQVAREMYLRGDWITPTLGGFNWFEKPALLYWLQIASYKVFGVSEFAARFGSALFGLGTAGSLFLLGKSQSLPEGVSSSKFQVSSSESQVAGSESRVSGSKFQVSGSDAEAENSELKTQNSKLKTSPGAWFFLISATSLGLMVFSRGASFDIILTFPVTASLVSFFIWDTKTRNGKNGTMWLVSFYAFIGLSLIAKGLIGAVFPGAIAAFYLVLSRRWPEKELVVSAFWGAAITLLVAAVWYLPMFLQHGWEFWNEFFVQHHFERYTSNKYKHPGPFWYFWVILPAMTIPWIPFFIASVWRIAKRLVFRVKRTSEEPDFIDENCELVVFASAWMIVPLVFFTLSGSKLPGYILPAFGGAAVITALYVREFAAKARWRNVAAKLNAAAMLVVFVCLLVFVLPGVARDDSVKHMIEKADERGFSDAKILNMHTISHNSEFYGSGRQVREKDGQLWKFLGVGGVVDYMRSNGGKPVLVLIPHDFENQLTQSPLIKSEILEREGELSIVLVRLHKQ